MKKNSIFFSNYPMNIYTHAQRYHCSNWVHCIMISICWTFDCPLIRSVKWIWILEIFAIYIWRWFIKTAVLPKFGYHSRPFSSHSSWPSCAGFGIVSINYNVHQFSLSICCLVWEAHWHSWIVSFFFRLFSQMHKMMIRPKFYSDFNWILITFLHHQFRSSTWLCISICRLCHCWLTFVKVFSMLNYCHSGWYLPVSIC